MSRTDICALEAQALARLYRQRKLSPVEVTRALLDAIEEKQPQYNLFITVTSESALLEAGMAEKRMLQDQLLSPFDGVPFGVKDIMYTKGVATTMGCEIYRNFIPEYSATAIEKLQASGAILMGKLNTHQLAFGPTGDRTIIGPARNPHNPQKICGGSSSGSAGSVAAGLLPLSLGSDTGGSVRQPSAFCGVVGMKATHGRVSIYGVKPLCEEMDCIGPHTRKVYDNASALNILAGYDPKDLFSADVPVCPDYTGRIGESVKNAVIGVPWGMLEADLIQPDVWTAFKNAVAELEKQGAVIKEIAFPSAGDMTNYRRAQQIMTIAGGYTVHKRDLLEDSALLAEEIRERLKTGNLPVDEYIHARHVQLKVKAIFSELMQDVDIMMMPTMPIVAINLEEREVDFGKEKRAIYECCTRYTWFTSFVGFPALSMPFGESDGLPVGLQMVGHPWEEDNIYRFAAALERELA